MTALAPLPTPFTIPTSPVAGGDSSGNLKPNSAGRIIAMRFVARRSGVLSKLHIQFRNLAGDGSSYYGGTGGSFIFEFRKVDFSTGYPDMTAAGLLATETFLPSDARIVNYSGYVTGNFTVQQGSMYYLLCRNGDATPATNYASWNFLYFGSQIPGAQSRNELSRFATDSYFNLDPRELVGGTSDSGATWNIPGTTDPAKTTVKNLPVYVQEFADGTKLGQPYFSAAGSAPGLWTAVFQQVTRAWTFSALRCYVSDNAGSSSVGVYVDDVLQRTGTLTGIANSVCTVTLPGSVTVGIGSVLKIKYTVDPTGAAGVDSRPVYARSPEFTGLIGLGNTYQNYSIGPSGEPTYYQPPIYPVTSR